jgi:hypothetical protein
MDVFYSAQLSVPVIQIVFLLLISTLALLYGRIKLALLINYVYSVLGLYPEHGCDSRNGALYH